MLVEGIRSMTKSSRIICSYYDLRPLPYLAAQLIVLYCSSYSWYTVYKSDLVNTVASLDIFTDSDIMESMY